MSMCLSLPDENLALKIQMLDINMSAWQFIPISSIALQHLVEGLFYHLLAQAYAIEPNILVFYKQLFQLFFLAIFHIISWLEFNQMSNCR